MSILNTHRSAPLRVPVGSLIAVAPPGTGKTTVLRQQLTAAGLPGDRVVCRDEIRSRLGRSCPDLAHRMAPATCHHFEERVTEVVSATANSHLIAGQSWFYDQTGCDEQWLSVEIDRAHAQGLAAVALRRRGDDGNVDVTFDFCLANDAARTRKVPRDRLRSMYEAYQQLTPDRLLELGFDVVLEWDADTRFQLMPEGIDARHLTADLAIVGDIHGCAETFLDRMLPALGTDRDLSNPDIVVVSVGDITDKGKHSVDMIRWWLWALRTGRALMVDSNHNKSLIRALTKPDANVRYGLAETIAQIEAQPDAEQLKAQIVASFSRLPNHMVFPDHVVVHAALTEDKLFKTDSRTRGFALHTRYDKTPWEWTGTQTLVHGHVIVGQPTVRRAAPSDERSGHIPGPVIAVDTGAYSGGGLTAYLTATGECITVDSADGDTIDPAVEATIKAELVAAGIVPACQEQASAS